MTLRPGVEGQAQAIDQRQVADGQLEEASALTMRHDGSSATLWRSRSQNGCAPRGLDEPDRPLDGPDLDDVADRERHVLATVDRDERLVGVDDRAADDLARADDDRPDGRQVGGDRRDDEVAAARVEDRAAGRERIAGRAGRAGDDEAVGDERREVRVVDGDIEPADAGERAAGDDDVVEGDEARRSVRIGVAAAQDPALEAIRSSMREAAVDDRARGRPRARRPPPSTGSRPCRG